MSVYILCETESLQHFWKVTTKIMEHFDMKHLGIMLYANAFKEEFKKIQEMPSDPRRLKQKTLHFTETAMLII